MVGWRREGSPHEFEILTQLWGRDICCGKRRGNHHISQFNQRNSTNSQSPSTLKLCPVYPPPTGSNTISLSAIVRRHCTVGETQSDLPCSSITLFHDMILVSTFLSENSTVVLAYCKSYMKERNKNINLPIELCKL